MLKARNLITGLVSLLISQLSFAGTATGTLSVTANVGDTCTVSSGSSLLAFGTFSPGGAALNTNGNVVVTCSSGDTYTVTLDKGSGTGATIPVRVLTNPSPAGTLQYTIYTTAGRTIVWGDGSGSSQTVAGTGTGVAQNITAYGTIFAGQTATATPGNYTDTVNITVTFSP